MTSAKPVMFNLIICMCKLRHLPGFPKAQEAGLQEQLEYRARSCWVSILVPLNFVGDSISGDLSFWEKRQIGRQPHGESCVLHGFKKVLREARVSEALVSQADLWAEVVSAVGPVYPQRVSTVLWMKAMVGWSLSAPICPSDITLPAHHAFFTFLPQMQQFLLLQAVMFSLWVWYCFLILQPSVHFLKEGLLGLAITQSKPVWFALSLIWNLSVSE